MGILEWIFGKKEPLPPKNPMDWKLTKSSTPWEREDYCKFCKDPVFHREWMADICDSCGSYGGCRERRTYRKIWSGHKWVRQDKYGNGPEDFTLDGKKPNWNGGKEPTQ
jgi:hypothetical protein